MMSTYFYSRILQPVVIRKNNFLVSCRSDYYYDDISSEMIVSTIAEHCHWTVNKIMADLFCQYRRWIKFTSIIPGLTLNGLKFYVPQIVENTLNFPAIGLYWLLEEISSNLNQTGNSYVFKTKSSKYCFHMKYSLLLLLSIYT